MLQYWRTSNTTKGEKKHVVEYNLILTASIIKLYSIIAFDIIQRCANMAQSHQNSPSWSRSDTKEQRGEEKWSTAPQVQLTEAFLIFLQIQKWGRRLFQHDGFQLFCFNSSFTILHPSFQPLKIIVYHIPMLLSHKYSHSTPAWLDKRKTQSSTMIRRPRNPSHHICQAVSSVQFLPPCTLWWAEELWGFDNSKKILWKTTLIAHLTGLMCCSHHGEC